VNLLISTLDIISSIAAHAEVNGFSGSKLSKFFGLWLLTARRSSDTDDWDAFYSRWESAGKIMEHLFLSWLRSAPFDLPALPCYLSITCLTEMKQPSTNCRDGFSNSLITILFLRHQRTMGFYLDLASLHGNMTHYSSA
jgi:hypothetical protein